MISEQLGKDIDNIVEQFSDTNPEISKNYMRDLLAIAWHRGYNTGYREAANSYLEKLKKS